MMMPFRGPVTGQLSIWQGSMGELLECTTASPYRFRASTNPLGWGRAVEWGTHRPSQSLSTQ